MVFDPLVINPGRLAILACLAGQPTQAQEFVALRGTSGLTDGNLATHARRLASAGLISVDKQLRAGRPVTTFHLTPRGRQALTEHVQTLHQALTPADRSVHFEEPVSAPPLPLTTELESAADDWVD